MYYKFCCEKQHKHFNFHTFKDTGILPVDTCASGSAVEHLLAKEGVAGSIPVSRLNKKDIQLDILFCLTSSPTHRNQEKCGAFSPSRLACKSQFQLPVFVPQSSIFSAPRPSAQNRGLKLSHIFLNNCHDFSTSHYR